MKKMITAAVLFITVAGASAQTKPFNLSLTPDIAVYDQTTEIRGITLSIWGENPQHSLAIGLVNGATGDSTGLSLGLINQADNYKGVQWGAVNYASGNLTGWQGGPLFGFPISAFNYTTGDLTGLQSGLVNYAGGSGPGVQVGLVNLMPMNEMFSNLPRELAPAMVFVNWRF
jgi:hypothetical protein